MSDIVTDDYTGLNFLNLRGQAVGGASARSTIDDTLGLGIWGDAVGGSAASATIEDAALLMYADCVGGGVLQARAEEDIIFTVVDIYGSAICSSTTKARMFIDPVPTSAARYLNQGKKQ